MSTPTKILYSTAFNGREAIAVESWDSEYGDTCLDIHVRDKGECSFQSVAFYGGWGSSDYDNAKTIAYRYCDQYVSEMIEFSEIDPINR